MEVGGNRWLYFLYVLLCSTLYKYTMDDDEWYLHPHTNENSRQKKLYIYCNVQSRGLFLIKSRCF